MEEQASNQPYMPGSTEPFQGFNELNKSIQKMNTEIRKVVVGQDNMVELLLVGLLTGGHVLLEGVPGIAKTLTAKTLAKTLDVDFSRIQFTPDLMPSDVTGTAVFNVKSSEFSFNKGPIFSNIVMIDEINRAPAKTQAALFEVMEEQQVTVDGKTYVLDDPFFVIATQNPVEQEGTYRLPEAQLDRFLFKIKLTYPDLEEEQLILHKFKDNFKQLVSEEVKAIIKGKEIAKLRSMIEKIHIQDELISYIALIVSNTRNNGDLFLGASPRASLAILKTAKTLAAIRGRGFVTPDDIKYVTYPVLNHRVILSSDREMEGVSTEDVIKTIIEQIEIPR